MGATVSSRVLPLLALHVQPPVASRLRGTSRRGAGAGARVRCDRFHPPNLEPQLGEGLRIYILVLHLTMYVSVSSDVFRLPKQAFKISHQPLLRVLSFFLLNLISSYRHEFYRISRDVTCVWRRIETVAASSRSPGSCSTAQTKLRTETCSSVRSGRGVLCRPGHCSHRHQAPACHRARPRSPFVPLTLCTAGPPVYCTCLRHAHYLPSSRGPASNATIAEAQATAVQQCAGTGTSPRRARPT